MWVFMRDSFLSIVEDREHSSGTLLVRARVKGDIERVFPGRRGIAKKGTDYAYRCSIPRKEVAEAIARAVEDINYDNFKDSVANMRRHAAYLGVWARMASLQTVRKRKPDLYDRYSDEELQSRFRIPGVMAWRS